MREKGSRCPGEREAEATTREKRAQNSVRMQASLQQDREHHTGNRYHTVHFLTNLSRGRLYVPWVRLKVASFHT